MSKVVADEPLSVAARIADLAYEVLAGAGPIAAIVHGSTVSGDFVAGQSDIDVLFVVGRALADEEIRTLTARLTDAEAGRQLDVRVVTRAAAASPEQTPPMEFQFSRHAGEADEVVAHSSGESDLLVEFRLARQHGQSLRGRRPEEVIGPVPDAWILAHGLRLLERWMDLAADEAHAELMILTACRIWRFAETRTIESKSAAADWALRQAPELTAIASALCRRHGDPAVRIAARNVAAVLVAARRAVETELAILQDSAESPNDATTRM